MTSKKYVDEFLTKKNIAVVGVSRNKGKFGNVIYKELKKKGYIPFAVNTKLEQFEGDECYGSLIELKDKIDSIVIVVPPEQTEKIVKEAKNIGVKYIWMQQGSESDKAIEFCKENNISVIHNECLLMFLEPVNSIHSFHKWIWKVLGKLPK